MQDEFTVSPKEAVQIAVSVLAISFAFSMIFVTPAGILTYPGEWMAFMALSLVTIGSGFILHEMSHKIAAIYYGARAQFVMWTQGIIFMLITSFFGVLFAAPGAVYIYSRNITKKQNGIISLAGPVTNLAILAMFTVLAVALPVTLHFSSLQGFMFFGIRYGAVSVWQFGIAINLILAMFNMIPAFPLDGSKVFMWNRFAWAAFTGLLLTIALLFFPISMVIGWAFIFLIAMIFSKMFFG